MSDPDVVVVGGGPAGSAASHWLARAGHSVLMVEKKEYPREKTCGDGLTPRAIKQLDDMGFDFGLPEFHKVTGLRSYAGDDLKIELTWPDHGEFPNWGGVIRRADLDEQVARLSEKEGVVVREKTEAKPITDGSAIVGVELHHGGDVQVVKPHQVIVADGSLSRFGRELGSSRNKAYPMGLAARGYFSSPMSDDGFMESQLDIRDESGASMPGYGWVFPLGDGTVNVGVGLLSTFKRWKHVNTTDMMNNYVASAPEYWGLSPESQLTKPRGGKLSMSFSVGPKVGPNWLTIGDAAGAINPWNGEGISYAYETGRMAAEVMSASIKADDPSLLARYESKLDAEYADYYRMARVFVKAIGYPFVMRSLAHVGLRNRPLMEWVLKVMSNLLDESERSVGLQAYDVLESMVRRAPAALTE